MCNLLLRCKDQTEQIDHKHNLYLFFILNWCLKMLFPKLQNIMREREGGPNLSYITSNKEMAFCSQAR